MPRTPIIVNFDGKDHRILDGEATACGLIAPHGLEWQSEVSKPCPVCFPEGKKAANTEPEPEPVLSIATPAEELGRYENPDAEEGEPGFIEPAKPAKKATKAG